MGSSKPRVLVTLMEFLFACFLMFPGPPLIWLEGKADSPEPSPVLEHVEMGAPEAATREDLVLEDLREDLEALGKGLAELSRSMAEFRESVYRELLVENARLRKAVRLRYERPGGLRAVPMPNRDLIEAVINDRFPKVSGVELEALEPTEFQYRVVKEWGRTPEVAAQFSADTSSLQGMVIAVAKESTDDELEEFARDLREKYEAYDNINIEVFTSRAAAEAYAERGRADPRRRVVSISKHRESGRDLMLIIRHNLIRPIAPRASRP